MRQTDRVVSAPTVPGRLPVLGHLPQLAVKRSEFLQSAIGLGDVVKIYLGTKPIYVANSPDAIHEMLVTQSRSFGKGLVFQRVRPYLGNGLITSDGEFHRRQRRSLQPAFHRERIAEYITAMMQVAEEQTSEWRPGEVIRIDRAMRRLSAAMLVATLFASQNATISDAVAAIAERVGDDLNVFIRGVFVYMLLPAWFAAVPSPGRRKFLTAADALRDLADSTVRQARENQASGHDLLSIMLRAPEDGSGGMSDEDARDELLTLLIAGVETTGTTLSWAIHVLGQHPDMADRMHAESSENPVGFLPTAAMRIERRDTEEHLWPWCPVLLHRFWRGRRSPRCAVLTGPRCPPTRAAPIPLPRSRCITRLRCRGHPALDGAGQERSSENAGTRYTDEHWLRDTLAAVESLHLPPGDNPARSGLDGMFERAGHALIRALQAGPVHVPGHRLQPIPGRGGEHCPARELSPTWHRAERLTSDGAAAVRGAGAAWRLACGCGDDGPCIWAWAAEHYAAVPPGLDWDTMDRQVTDSPLLREVRALGIPEEALAATKGRPPRTEGGLWDQAVRAWGLAVPLTSRVYGVTGHHDGAVRPAGRGR